jgi:HAD superfamily hydrolase (TIGR01490 family)
MTAQRLALFDLDHTLLPIDSDVLWAQQLVELGVVDPSWHTTRNDYFYEQYKQGSLDMDEFLAFQLGPLAQHSVEQLHAWREAFLQTKILPQIRPAARALVEQHQQQGDLIALVTATNDFVTAPIAQAFGIEHLIATQVERDAEGRYTGRPVGLPSFQAGKVTRVRQWLASLDLGLESFEASYFYSDSRNDLPLLARVTHPIAVNPDPTLRAHALEQGWPILDLFAQEPGAT